MSTNTKQHTDRITSQFTRVLMRLVTQRSLADLNDQELSMSQLQCLRYLSRHPNSRLCQISEGLSISNPASTKLIDRLVKKELVHSIQCSCDRRSMEVNLTEKGHQLVENFKQRRLERLDGIFLRMNSSDREALLIGMESFIKASLIDENSTKSACLCCGDEHDPECLIDQTYQLLTGKPAAF